MRKYTETIYQTYEKRELKKRITPYIKAICDYYQMDVRLLTAKIRDRDIVRKRQILYHILYENKKFNHITWGQMANYFAERDHATAMHGAAKVRNLITPVGTNGHTRVPDMQLKTDVEAIIKML